MRTLKLFYPLPDYKSHRRTAQSYQAILRDSCELVSERQCQDADIVMFHGEAEYEELYQEWPELARKYVIAYCVWEASDIPAVYKRALGRVQEVWTASRYCEQVLGRYHPSVVRVPHVVERDTACDDEDLAFVKRAIDYEPDKSYYLIIARRWGGRKNVNGLMRAFERLRTRMPDARLIVKMGARRLPREIADPRIRYVAERWTDRQINALYQLCDVYVSPHYAEGWGLTMSDAMLFGKPVIATGYSGNLEFMHDANSFLIDFDETCIRGEDIYGLFEPTMKWAYPRDEDLDRKLLCAYESLGSESLASRVRRASADLRCFARAAVAPILEQRLQRIRASL
jgi:glycosyltransferase involved in cell wall biosynthesis